MKFSPHSKKQSDAIFSEKRLTIIASGIQYGKTIAGVVWLKMKMHDKPGPNDNYIIASPTYKILYQSTLPPFLKYNEDIGHYNKKHEVFEMYSGAKIWFRTGQIPDSPVGITNVRAILCDEAGLFSRYFWDNLQARAAFGQAPVMIVTSPYSLNWLYQDFIRPWHKGDEYVRQLIHLVQATSKENPYFPDQEYEDRKRTMDARRFNMIFGGQFEKAEGLVYDIWNDEAGIVEPFTLPPGSEFIGAIDWGYTDPCAIVVRGITPDKYQYQVGEFYKTRQQIEDIAEACCQFMSLWPIKWFKCDPSRPDYITKLCALGIPAVPANNEIRLGIDAHYDLIKNGRYMIFRGSSPNTLSELEMYHYPEPKDLKPDQNAKDELPVDQFNHAMDANRYISIDYALPIKPKRAKLAHTTKYNLALSPIDVDRERLLRPKKRIMTGY